MQSPKSILAISGSPRRGSSAAMLLQAMAVLAPENISISLYDSITDLPHFSPELDAEPLPEAVAELRKLIRSSSAVIICTPEYAFSMPSVLKNLLEWTVSSADLYEKPTATISLSPNFGGGKKAHDSLLIVLGAVGASIPDGGSLTLGNIRKRMTEAGEITDAELQKALSELLGKLL